MSNAATIVINDYSSTKSCKKESDVKVKSIRLSHVQEVILVFVAVVVFLLLGTSSASGQYTAQVIPR